jgi:predicted RNase H-related nuclease YkuK (DUF458 family)
MSIIEKAKAAITASSKESSVYVGADSIRFKKQGKWFARYSTVVIIHKDSNKGGKIFYQDQVLPDYGNIKMRLLQEVSYAIEVASELIDVVDGRHLAIHLDLNADPKHKSNVAVKEALGYVKGTLGIDADIKPYSWASSHAADHVVRSKLKSAIH